MFLVANESKKCQLSAETYSCYCYNAIVGTAFFQHKENNNNNNNNNNRKKINDDEINIFVTVMGNFHFQVLLVRMQQIQKLGCQFQGLVAPMHYKAFQLSIQYPPWGKGGRWGQRGNSLPPHVILRPSALGLLPFIVILRLQVD